MALFLLNLDLSEIRVLTHFKSQDFGKNRNLYFILNETSAQAVSFLKTIYYVTTPTVSFSFILFFFNRATVQFLDL